MFTQLNNQTVLFQTIQFIMSFVSIQFKCQTVLFHSQCHIQENRWGWGGLTPLQRCSRCILQHQPTEMVVLVVVVAVVGVEGKKRVKEMERKKKQKREKKREREMFTLVLLFNGMSNPCGFFQCWKLIHF